MTRLHAFFLSLIAAFWIVAQPVTAQDATDKGIEATISGQLEAFKADDVGTAFDFASPMIKNIFRTPENFGAMVQQGYPMVWRPAEVTYLDQRAVGPEIWQKVRITDGAGRIHILEYQMIPVADGWQINGVQLLREPEVTA